MKTTHSPENAAAFLQTVEHADPNSLQQLTEGHVSQAFSFETVDGEKRVLRISGKRNDFDADKYASDTFGADLLVPRVIDLGKFDANSFYCISEFADGKTTDDALNDAELAIALPSIQNALAAIYHFDISATTGYGPINPTTGNAKYDNWKTAVTTEIIESGVEDFRNHATSIGLESSVADAFFDQMHNNLDYASETRRLLHGDPAFNNMLVADGQVTAHFDWAQMAYGDWMSDFARLGFWWPGRYGDAKQFATEFDLDAEHIEQRDALYCAINALHTISFADRYKTTSTAAWLRENVRDRLTK